MTCWVASLQPTAIFLVIFLWWSNLRTPRPQPLRLSTRWGYYTDRVLSVVWLYSSASVFECHTTASASFYCISCKWCVVTSMCNERVLEHDWEPNSSFCAIGTHRWWRPERMRQRSTRLVNYTAQQLRERHSSSSSSMTSARLTPCTSFLSRWNLYPSSSFMGLTSFVHNLKQFLIHSDLILGFFLIVLFEIVVSFGDVVFWVLPSVQNILNVCFYTRIIFVFSCQSSAHLPGDMSIFLVITVILPLNVF